MCIMNRNLSNVRWFRITRRYKGGHRQFLKFNCYSHHSTLYLRTSATISPLILVHLRHSSFPAFIFIFIMCRRDVNTTVYTCGHTKATYTIVPTGNCGGACSNIPDNHMASTRARRPCDDCLA